MNDIPDDQAHTPTFADAAALLRGCTELDPTRGRDLIADLTAAARMLELPLAAIPCDVAWLNARLFRQPPAAFRMSQRRFRNVVSSLRAVLRRLDQDQPRDPGPVHSSIAGGPR